MKAIYEAPLRAVQRFIKRSSFLLGFLAFHSPAFSAQPLFHGLPYETFRVPTVDGADLALFRLKGNENGPPVMLSPGVVENAEALDSLAAAFHLQGYRVYLGQVRFAGRGANRSNGNLHGLNGFEEAWEYDFPAMVRFVYENAGRKPVHLVGHSMGGILSLILLSLYGEEFQSKVAAVTTIGSPYQFKSLPRKIIWEVRAILPVLEWVRDHLNLEKVDWHLRWIDSIQKLKQSTHGAVRQSARTAEKIVMKAANYILHTIMTDLNHVSDEGMERLLQQEIAELPIQFLIDFANLALRGEFYSRSGDLRLIRPENIHVPFQVVGGEYDDLVPVAEIKNLHHYLGSESKRLVIVRDMKHVTLVTANLETSLGYYSALIDFHNHPERVSKNSGVLVVTPRSFDQVFNDPRLLSFPKSYFGCQSLLTRQ